MYRLFPFHIIPQGARVLFYGGGVAGKNYLRQIWETNYCSVVAITDRNYKELRIRDAKIIAPEDIKKEEFDYLFVTPMDRVASREIVDKVMSMGVPEEKIITYTSRTIIWTDPKVGFASQEQEYQIKRTITDYIREFDPHILVSSERIDITVRYLLFLDFFNDMDSETHQSLFSRFIFSRTRGIELASFYSDGKKNLVQDYLDKGKELCKDMELNGFNKSKFLPLGRENRPFDGLHRMAAALAAGEKVYAHVYPDVQSRECRFEWFKEQGFLFEDQVRIMRGFSDLYPGQLGILILYAPAQNYWGFIEGQASREYTLVGSIDYDFSDYYYTFENILRQIYSDWNTSSEWLTRKLELLYLTDLKYRVIVISDENEKHCDDFYASIHAFKKKIRECLGFEIDENVPIQIHSSDSQAEYEHLKKIFLSANNISWEKRKAKIYYRGIFFERLYKLKQFLKAKKIPLDHACIVGSMVLELFHIRHAGNLNFIIKRKYVAELKTEDKELELIKPAYCLKENHDEIPNDIIIDNDEYHTYYYGLKFCNLEYVYRFKQIRGRGKDMGDVRRIDAWYRNEAIRNNQILLQQQIKKELMKRGI